MLIVSRRNLRSEIGEGDPSSERDPRVELEQKAAMQEVLDSICELFGPFLIIIR